jgi:DNA-directed RNA polymerase specialized sigma subunit
MSSEIEAQAEAKEVVERIRLLYEHYIGLGNERYSKGNPKLIAAILRFRIAPEAFGEKTLTQKEVGKICSVSTCRANQQERRVYHKLRNFLNNKVTIPGPIDVDILLARLKSQGVLKWKE